MFERNLNRTYNGINGPARPLFIVSLGCRFEAFGKAQVTSLSQSLTFLTLERNIGKVSKVSKL